MIIDKVENIGKYAALGETSGPRLNGWPGRTCPRLCPEQSRWTARQS